MTCQVPEEKKSWTPLNVLAITGRFFRSSSRQETRARRSRPGRTPRSRARSTCRQRSPSYALILGQIGEQVKGAGDEQRLSEGAAAGERLPGIVDCLDLLEVASGPLGQVGGGERPRRGGRGIPPPAGGGGGGLRPPAPTPPPAPSSRGGPSHSGSPTTTIAP